MKKVLFLATALIGFAFSSNAQTASTLPLTVGDTVVNTGTSNKIITVTAGYSGVVIQPILTKISGTVGGTIALYASTDGVNYVATGDTFTPTDQTTNTAVWNKAAPNPVYYKILATGTGTMSAKLTVKYVTRKYNP